MKLKLKTSRVGEDEHGREFIQNYGEVIEVDEALGLRMIEAEQAEPVEDGDPAQETNKAPAPADDSRPTKKPRSSNKK